MDFAKSFVGHGNKGLQYFSLTNYLYMATVVFVRTLDKENAIQADVLSRVAVLGWCNDNGVGGIAHGDKKHP